MERRFFQAVLGLLSLIPLIGAAIAIGPGPAAVHAARRFAPDADYHEHEVARRYEASGRVDGYLGDWHTHPLGRPRLSRADRRTLRLIARSSAARAPTLPEETHCRCASGQASC